MLTRPSALQAGLLAATLILIGISVVSWKMRAIVADFIESNLKGLLPSPPSLDLRPVAESYVAAGFAPGVLLGLSLAGGLFCLFVLIWNILPSRQGGPVSTTKGATKDGGGGSRDPL